MRRHNPPNPLATARRFLRHHIGRECFAPFTGQDFSAWSSFVYACELYGRADISGRMSCVIAMRALVEASQPSVRYAFVWTIPAILDWSHAREIWPTVAPGDKSDVLRTVLRTGGYQ